MTNTTTATTVTTSKSTNSTSKPRVTAAQATAPAAPESSSVIPAVSAAIGGTILLACLGGCLFVWVRGIKRERAAQRRSAAKPSSMPEMLSARESVRQLADPAATNGGSLNSVGSFSDDGNVPAPVTGTYQSTLRVPQPDTGQYAPAPARPQEYGQLALKPNGAVTELRELAP